jgi:hypothetical protein
MIIHHSVWFCRLMETDVFKNIQLFSSQALDSPTKTMLPSHKFGQAILVLSDDIFNTCLFQPLTSFFAFNYTTFPVLFEMGITTVI